MTDRRSKSPRPPLTREALERLALHYVERYATTRAKLAAYLRRKIRERGWEGEPPDIDALVARLAERNYVDDRAFASARAQALTRRGYGRNRVALALRMAGIEDVDAEEARAETDPQALDAALRFAERRRVGPFARAPADRPARDKALAAMLRAGHPLELAPLLLRGAPGELPEREND